MQMRLLLPVFSLILGYCIFVLEGAQSAVILANKQSAETLDRILATIDLSNAARKSSTNALSKIIDGAKIDNFIIGRQLLIIALAFLFKISYDGSSLSLGESQALSQAATHCVLQPAWVIAVYKFIDNWLFSTLLCSILVAYFFQVPSKLMAQYYPLRFLTTIPLTIYSPRTAQVIGDISLLGKPLNALRKRGMARVSNDRFSYFAGKEQTPVSTQQVFEALTSFYGECIRTIIITISPESPTNKITWFVKDETQYELIRANREFSQTIQVPQMSALDFEVFAINSSGEKRVPLHTNAQHYNLVPTDPGGITEVVSRIYAEFDVALPKGSFVNWSMNYSTPVLTELAKKSGLRRRIFDIHIKKPVETVVFRVTGGAGVQPEADVEAVDGAEKPTCGEIIPMSPTPASKGIVIHYPPVGSKIIFKF
jgi:hypothetical protein